jgi:hypothetical protein
VLVIADSLMSDFCLSQSLVATSSGEAEYYGGCAVVAEGIHLQNVLEFFDHWFAILWQTDSKVAMAVSERMGVGRIKHLEVKSLWLQEKVKMNAVLPEKVDTLVNMSDLNTKVHPKPRFEFLVSLMGIADYIKETATQARNAREAIAGGLTGIAPRTLAVAITISELLRHASAEGEIALRCPAPLVGASADDWIKARAPAWFSLVKMITVVVMLIFLIGCCAGWKLSRWVAPPAGVVAPKAAKQRNKKQHKQTQSQTKYTWHKATPRFQPLTEFDHGCWDG